MTTLFRTKDMEAESQQLTDNISNQVKDSTWSWLPCSSHWTVPGLSCIENEPCMVQKESVCIIESDRREQHVLPAIVAECLLAMIPENSERNHTQSHFAISAAKVVIRSNSNYLQLNYCNSSSVIATICPNYSEGGSRSKRLQLNSFLRNVSAAIVRRRRRGESRPTVVATARSFNWPQCSR